MTNARDKTSRIDLQKSLRLLVRVYLDILVLQAFELHRNPHTLDEGATIHTSAI